MLVGVPTTYRITTDGVVSLISGPELRNDTLSYFAEGSNNYIPYIPGPYTGWTYVIYPDQTDVTADADFTVPFINVPIYLGKAMPYTSSSFTLVQSEGWRAGDDNGVLASSRMEIYGQTFVTAGTACPIFYVLQPYKSV